MDEDADVPDEEYLEFLRKQKAREKQMLLLRRVEEEWDER